MPYRSSPDVKRPSEQLEDLMLGRIGWDDAPDAIKSWARFHIYGAAKQILAAPDKGTRRNMLGRVPAHMRARVEAEIKRLWAIR
jgi:hypothetical protein